MPTTATHWTNASEVRPRSITWNVYRRREGKPALLCESFTWEGGARIYARWVGPDAFVAGVAA